MTTRTRKPSRSSHSPPYLLYYCTPPRSVEHGESDQRPLVGGGHRYKQSSSTEMSNYRRYDNERGSSGFSLPLRLFSIVTGDQLPDHPSRNRSLEEQVKRMREAHLLKERELQRVAQTHLLIAKELEAKLAEKAAELEESKRVHCMYDDVSEIVIHNLVDNINTRTQELAQRTAVRWFKGLSKASSRAKASGEAGKAEVVKIEGLLGIQLSNALHLTTAQGQIHRSAPMFLQFAWQASIVATVAKILSSFSSGLPSSGYGQPRGKVFRRVAEGVMSGEVQVQAYIDEALGHCRTVGQLAMKDCCPNDRAFAGAFRPQLQVIMEEAFKLLTAIQARMITANYEPYIPSDGDEFHPESMVVAQQDNPFPNGRVVCTTGLGLLYWSEEGSEDASEMSPSSVFKEAQVLTEGILDDLVASRSRSVNVG